MTYYAKNDYKFCYISCGYEMKVSGLCMCNNRFTNNMWRVVDEYRLQNESNVVTLPYSTTIDPNVHLLMIY
jgi:hypothetical protein